MTIVEACVRLIEVYLGVGLVFAVPFAWRWVARVDPGAADGTLGFRVLLVPGVAAFWPLFAWRLTRGRRGGGARVIRRLRERHLRIFGALAVGLPVLFVSALLARPEPGAATLGAELPGPLGGPLARVPADVGAGGAPAAEPLLRRAGDWLAIGLPRDWNEPDVLVYWSVEQPIEERLPRGARLLGALVGETAARVPLPVELRGAPGFLLLYSLAHARVLLATPAAEATR